MAIFADLDDGDEIPCLNEKPFRDDWRRFHGVYTMAMHEYPSRTRPFLDLKEDDGRVNPNLNVITEALGCYPIISVIASHLDLNSLEHLSRTCRQARSNLLQFRKQLINSTLHCVNESIEPDPENTLRFRARASDWYFVEPDGARAVGAGKVGDCARDMVGACRRCSTIVCRNCTIKSPADILLSKRHRRLCPTCIKTPIHQLLPSCSLQTSSLASSSPVQSSSYCLCPTTGTYLCQPCGRSLRSADTTYDSIWRWRTRYNASGSGGMGTGISDGNRSFECGLASKCKKARWVEEEIDCDAEDARELFGGASDGSSVGSWDSSSVGSSGASSGSSSAHSSPGSSSYVSANAAAGSYGSTSGHMAPGYMRHEIEGIGGVVKKKMLRMVQVGACVTEWEDEKERGMYLVREAEGRCRSLCGWCHRIVLGEADRAALGISGKK